LTNRDHEKKLEDARSLLESVTLLEVVAAEREAKAGSLMESLVDDGLQPEEVAERLDISERSVETILNQDEPKPPHERIGISQESIDNLDPINTAEPKLAT
jgi:2-keto-3-deoxy-6-phosphogluconate aldolase